MASATLLPSPTFAPPLAADAPPRPARLASLDAYRGLVMLLMMAEVLRLQTVADATGSGFWKFLALHQSHSAWLGCTLHDLIQPSFTFLVGAALPFSIAARRHRGQSPAAMTLHAFWRALVLVVLGIFLRSTHSARTNYTFEDTLSQIGLGYGFLFIIGLCRPRVAWVALGIILVGYWAAFALYPLPPEGFNYAAAGVKAGWMDANALHGFAAHWNLNSNLGWAFDTWFANLFPREKPFVGHPGGYATLSFIPALGTMLLGLIGGRVVKAERTAGEKVRWLVVAGVVALACGWLAGVTGVCPVVKRIWTPSWVLFSGGWCFLFLAGFYALLDTGLRRGWAFPLVVIGTNSIAAYMIAHLFDAFIPDALKRHLGAGFFQVFGKAYQAAVLGACVLLVYWLILFWMYRRKIFLRI